MRILKIASKEKKDMRVENFRKITFIVNLFNFFYFLIYFFDQSIVETVYSHCKLF